MDEGRLQRLEPLTAETLLTTVAERKASSLNFESALREIEVEAALMDVYYEVDDEDQATAIARQHFDNEKIKEGHEYLLEMAQTVFTLLRDDQSYSAARTFVGRFLLTLQDFYAHSNWIELENRDILTDLGLSQSPKFLSNIADPWTFTCTECCDPNDSRCSESTSPGGCTTCYDNVRKSKLTSGYFIYDNSQTKPTGKCSHGSKTDRSRHTSPTGGINKSTKICAKSPHHYLHDEAAHLAISASRHFLSHVRSTAGDEGFRKLFNLAERNNLESSTSLCFVMDQTGSMQNDIDAAKNRTRQIITSSTKPYNYVLVQFGDDDNDPAYGPAIVTNDAAEFLAELDKLKADGGGDCPELTLHALQLALTKCLPGSSIFVFTDAGAKDLELEKTVYSLIENKGSQVYFFYTGRSRFPCSRNPFLFRDMAKKSGGQLLHIKRQTVVKSSVLTQTVAEGVTALLLSVVKKSRSASYVFTIDRTITKFTVSVTGYNSLSRLMRPDGSQYWQDRLSRSGHSLVTVPEKDVLVGEWTVTVLRSLLEHTVTVQAATSIDFLYQFVELAGRPGHLGVFPIIGQPVEGGLSKVVLTVAGMASLREVTELNVMTESGDIIDTLNSSWLEVGRRGSSNMFGVAFTTPKASFRLAMTAVDETGTVVRRLANTIVTAQPFKTRLDSQSNQVVKPGNRSDVTFKVYPSADESDVEISMNIEETSLLEDPMIDVIIQEADGSLVPLRKKRQTADLSTSKIRELKTVVTLKKGQVALVNVSFTVSKTAETGHVSSATIVIASGKSFNYVPVELVTAPPVDDKTPPRCDIVGHTGCNSDLTNETCDDHTWHVDARVVDLELGLLNIRSEHLAVNVSHSKFDKNNTLPVDVKAVASCCHRQVSLHTSDIVGNVQTCSVSLPPLKSIRKTEVTLPPTVKLATPRQKPPISSKNCKHQWERDDFVEAIMKQYVRQVSGLSADAKLTTVQFNFHVKRMLVNNSFLDADINRNGQLSSDEVQQFVFSLYKRSLVDQVECLLEFIERCRAERDRLDIHVWRECAEKGNMMTPTTQPIPTTDTPTTDAPTTDTATTDTPTTDAPTTDTPTTDASTTETATTDAPTTETATTDAPTTETATTDAPTTDIPTTDAPTTDTATQQRPTTAQITQSSKGCQEPLESDLIEQGMKAYLRLILGLSADTKLTEKQFSPVIRDLVVKNWFRDADLDGNSLLSSSELKQFARSLSERKLTDGAECVLASMERCRGDKKYLDTDGWAACSEKAGTLTPSSID